jgi:hypothetical protein
MVLEHLEQARRHVAEGELHLARQRALVVQLERGGHDTTQARKLLKQFEELQQMQLMTATGSKGTRGNFELRAPLTRYG